MVWNTQWKSEEKRTRQTGNGIVGVAASFDAVDARSELLEVVARQVPLINGWKDSGRAHSKGANDG